MFNQHHIAWENEESVLYLFVPPIEGSSVLAENIFAHIHEDVLYDWAQDYLIFSDSSFFGKRINIVSGHRIIRKINRAVEVKSSRADHAGKVIPFPLNTH